MKKTFTPKYIREHAGCYNDRQINALPFIAKKIITIEDVIDNVPFKDTIWFVFRKCGLTHFQKVSIAIIFAEKTLPFYEKQYPDDNIPKKAIEEAKKYGTESFDIANCRDAAYRANAAAYASTAAYAAYASTAANAANAAAYAYTAANAANAAYRAYAADTAADAADATANTAYRAYAAYAAADAANADAYRDDAEQEMKNLLKETIKNFD